MGECTGKSEQTWHAHSFIDEHCSILPFTPVRYCFHHRRAFDRTALALRMADWSATGRSLGSTVAVFHKWSTRITKAGGPSGYDACKWAKDHKWYFAVEVERSPTVVEAHPPGVRDRDGPLKTIVMPRVVPEVEALPAVCGYSSNEHSESLERERCRTSRRTRIPFHAFAAAGFRPEPHRHGVSRTRGSPAPLRTRIRPKAASR